MPITLTIPEDLLSAEAEAALFARLSATLLEVAGLAGNRFMTPNVVGTIQTVPRGRLFAGGKAVAAAFVELKLPPIALASAEAKQTFIERATAAVEEAAEGRIERAKIWVNIVYAAEGSWGIGGRAYDGEALIAAIQAA
jgi:phenylpyruvate tautomerase PptA (4-oxalocrotonate tautomerase family)